MLLYAHSMRFPSTIAATLDPLQKTVVTIPHMRYNPLIVLRQRSMR